jgi:hypothetical protein
VPKLGLWKAFSGVPAAAFAAAGYLKRLEALAQAFRLLSPLTTREEVYARTVQALKASTRAASALLFFTGFFTGRKGTSWNWWPRRGFPPPGWGCA